MSVSPPSLADWVDPLSREKFAMLTIQGERHPPTQGRIRVTSNSTS